MQLSPLRVSFILMWYMYQKKFNLMRNLVNRISSRRQNKLQTSCTYNVHKITGGNVDHQGI